MAPIQFTGTLLNKRDRQFNFTGGVPWKKKLVSTRNRVVRQSMLM
jgi:hypothetical protein